MGGGKALFAQKRAEAIFREVDNGVSDGRITCVVDGRSLPWDLYSLAAALAQDNMARMAAAGIRPTPQLTSALAEGFECMKVAMVAAYALGRGEIEETDSDQVYREAPWNYS